MKKLFLIAVILVSLGAGVLGALGIWTAGYLTGRVQSNTVVFFETKEFQDAVEAKEPFKFGGYYFVPKRNKVIVRKIAYREGN